MWTNVKRRLFSDPSELEVLRDKIRKLEATVKAKDVKEKELMSELQIFKNDQVDHETDESVLLVFMKNNGFKGIAFKIFSYLDCGSFVQCRQVCRSWKNFIDNEWPMLQLQIFHLKRHTNDQMAPVREWPRGYNSFELNLEPLFKIMENSKNKSKLRVFINMCQELALQRCHKLLDEPLQYMIDHHRHQELEILIDYPIQKTWKKNGEIFRPNISDQFTTIFKYACQFGCNICVQLFLDRSEEMEIDFNSVKTKESWMIDGYQFEHCLHVANDYADHPYRKEVLDLLLRNAEEKGIDINHKGYRGNNGTTLRDAIIQDFHNFGLEFEIEDFTDATYKILKIAKREILEILEN